jgi:hypothetical protein
VDTAFPKSYKQAPNNEDFRYLAGRKRFSSPKKYFEP